MSTINISEDDFAAVARAARNARDQGEMAHARVLDKLARKINASLSNASTNAECRRLGIGRTASALRWQDVPSTIGKPA